MPAPTSPFCSYKGSSPLARHVFSPTQQPTAVPCPDQRPRETSHLPGPPPSTSPSTSSGPSPAYSAPSSPVTPDPSAYPPVHADRSHPVFTSAHPAAMAPSNANARTSALAFDLAPTSTPTGRISKAKKGKRVHACEFPGCGKIFTRAEHRRRHELNHNPDATYHCRQNGCNKSFHRVDLLQRHQERHELEASGLPSQHRRFPSQTSALSEPPSSMPLTAMTSPALTDGAPRSNAGGMSIGALVHPASQQFATEMSAPFGVPGAPYLQWPASEESIFYGSDSSPMANRYDGRQSISSASSVTGFDVSGSPMVRASMPSHWLPGTAPPNTLPADMFGDEYISSTAAPSMPIPLSDLDGYEWSVIRGELSAVPGLLPSAGGAGVPDTVRWHCLELYWQYFHPTFPIVHRPTFLPAKPSPLLACAMVAIGSFYDALEDAKNYSLALLGIATKILRSRPAITNRSRLVDLQTVVLLEVLSTFYARQISVQMSTRFRALFANLNQAQHWLTTSPLAVFRTLKEKSTAADLSKAHKFFVEHETRSRILHACTVLDNQQAQLFEQSPTVRRHAGLRLNVGTPTQTYHLPCNDELWDASPIEHWIQLAKRHAYGKLVQGRPASPKAAADVSFFQSQVIAANEDQQTPRTSTGIKYKSFPPAGDGFSNKVFNYHVSEMCKHTPVRSLLMVTGETWLLGRKVEKQDDHAHAKQELRKWLNSATATRRVNIDSLVAQWHALKLVRGLVALKPTGTARHDELLGTTYMMHENWSLYLACLICWAHSRRKTVMDVVGTDAVVMPITVSGPGTVMAHGNGQPFPTATTTIDFAASAAPSSQATMEAQTYLAFSETSTPIALRDLGANVLSRVRGLLETVRREKIAAHLMGGLMNDAEQVLRKLVEGKARINF